jgi:hypothetical protein
MNDNLAALDVIVNCRFNEFVTSLPGSPAEGLTVIVASSGTSGPLVGKEGQIARYLGGVWNYYVPQTGWIAHNLTDRRYYSCRPNGVWTAWVSTGVATARPTANSDNHGLWYYATDTGAVYWNRLGNGWSVYSSGYMRGLAADRPAASQYYAGVEYFATDTNGGTRYRCEFVTSAWTWVKQSPGVSETGGDGGGGPHAATHLPGGGDPIDWGKILGFGTSFPTASALYANCFFVKTDENGGTLYQCREVASVWTWVKAARGATESTGGGGAAVLPETAGVPSDSPDTSEGYPARFDPLTKRLYVYSGPDWYFTKLERAYAGVGEIEGLAGWYVVDDASSYADGAVIPELAGRAGSVLDSSGVDSPIMRTAAVNGKRAAEFTGNQSFRFTDRLGMGLATAGEFFAVVKRVTGTMNPGGFRLGSGTGSHYLFDSDGNIYEDILRNSRPGFSPSSIDITQWHVLRVQSNTNYRVYLNGTTVYNVATGSFFMPSAPFYLTRNTASLQIAAWLFFDTSSKAGGVLTTEEYDLVRTWLNSFFGFSI